LFDAAAACGDAVAGRGRRQSITAPLFLIGIAQRSVSVAMNLRK
jgi:hypothetical protein